MSAIDVLLQAHQTRLAIQDMEAKMAKISKELVELNSKHSIAERELRNLTEQAFREWEHENA